MTEKLRYTFEQVADEFVPAAAATAARRFSRWRIEYEDVRQEIYVWLYGKGNHKVLRWLAADEQQTTRIWRSMLDVANGYCVTERAFRAGYDPDDDYWYTPGVIEALIPLAQDETFTGQVAEHEDGTSRPHKPMNEGGDLIAMVMDVRAASAKVGYSTEAIIEWLGGRKPRIGKRRVLSNTQAQAITQEQG